MCVCIYEISHLVEGVLDRDHGVVLDEGLVELGQLLSRHLLGAIVVLRLEVEVVDLLVRLPELGGGHVHADLHLCVDAYVAVKD